MDIHRLEVFCKVVEMQSFTKAADAVFLTQPTVSEHIRALEELVGEKLVDRLGREVLPTAAGKILYQYARDIIRLRNEAIQAIHRYKGSLSGHLTVGASTIPGTYLLPRLIGSFKARYPSIQITLRISDSAEVVDRIIEGALEAGLIGAPWDDRRLILEEVFSDELMLAVYPEHPWADGRVVAMEDLANEPFILRERGSGTRRVMAQALEVHGFDPMRLRVVAEMGSTEAVRQGIKARIGVSILSFHAVAEDIQQGSIARVEMEGITITRSFYLVQRKNRQSSPLCTAFLKHLRSEAGLPEEPSPPVTTGEHP
ncbi:MAG: LysR family transcriptional regulator [Syntrophobacteraceae bacterium]|nr:LysR family transcriptional regulator [Syntrophobacteraceae bacterium]